VYRDDNKLVVHAAISAQANLWVWNGCMPFLEHKAAAHTILIAFA
jgi:hypothetical protein